jgi:hypothetical protein
MLPPEVRAAGVKGLVCKSRTARDLIRAIDKLLSGKHLPFLASNLTSSDSQGLFWPNRASPHSGVGEFRRIVESRQGPTASLSTYYGVAGIVRRAGSVYSER